MSLTKQLTISVIVPVYNGGPAFEKCIQSLAHTTPPVHEIIVVVDGDSDGSWRVAKKFGAKIVELPRRSGPAKARNKGAQLATGDILLFVDADVTVPPNTSSLILDAFRHSPEIVALFGSYDDQPSEPNFLSQYKNLFHHFVHQTSNEDACTFWTGCGAILREIFLRMGGFDESYPRPSIEDIELGYRLKKAGYEIKLLKNLQVKHLKKWTPASLVKTDFLSRALPWAMLILKQGKLPNDLNLKVSTRISVIVTYMLIISVFSSIINPYFFVFVPACIILLIMLNMRFYLFFVREKGVIFAFKVLPWHWFYFIYSGFAFLVGCSRYLAQRVLGRPSP